MQQKFISLINKENLQNEKKFQYVYMNMKIPLGKEREIDTLRQNEREYEP